MQEAAFHDAGAVMVRSFAKIDAALDLSWLHGDLATAQIADFRIPRG